MIKLSKDGSEWCALIGSDLQIGVSGFGKTPELAIRKLRETVHPIMPPHKDLSHGDYVTIRELRRHESVYVNQPSAAPTQKMSAVALSSIITPAILAIAQQHLDVEITAESAVLVGSLITGAINFLSGYLVKEKA